MTYAGPAANSSLSLGEGFGGTADVFSGHGRNGSEVNGGGLTLGFQEGFAYSFGNTITSICPWGASRCP